MIEIVVGRVYAVKYGNTGRDSADLPKPYAVRLVKQTGNKKLNTEKVSWELVGKQQTPRTKLSGTCSPSSFRRIALRQLTPEQADAVAVGQRVPVEE